jgi:hypothetical protein
MARTFHAAKRRSCINKLYIAFQIQWLWTEGAKDLLQTKWATDGRCFSTFHKYRRVSKEEGAAKRMAAQECTYTASTPEYNRAILRWQRSFGCAGNMLFISAYIETTWRRWRIVRIGIRRTGWKLDFTLTTLGFRRCADILRTAKRTHDAYSM